MIMAVMLDIYIYSRFRVFKLVLANQPLTSDNVLDLNPLAWVQALHVCVTWLLRGHSGGQYQVKDEKGVILFCNSKHLAAIVTVKNVRL